MTNKDYIYYLDNLKSRIFKILPLCEEQNPNINLYIDSVLFETEGLFDIIPSSKSSVWHIRAVAVLSRLTTKYSNEQLHDSQIIEKVVRREILNLLNVIDKEIEFYRDNSDKKIEYHDLS